MLMNSVLYESGGHGIGTLEANSAHYYYSASKVSQRQREEKMSSVSILDVLIKITRYQHAQYLAHLDARILQLEMTAAVFYSL
jgi:hypothetical protein